MSAYLTYKLWKLVVVFLVFFVAGLMGMFRK